MSELAKGRASCHKTLLQMAAFPKVRSACCSPVSYLERDLLMWKMHLYVKPDDGDDDDEPVFWGDRDLLVLTK